MVPLLWASDFTWIRKLKAWAYRENSTSRRISAIALAEPSEPTRVVVPFSLSVTEGLHDWVSRQNCVLDRVIQNFTFLSWVEQRDALDKTGDITTRVWEAKTPTRQIFWSLLMKIIIALKTKMTIILSIKESLHGVKEGPLTSKLSLIFDKFRRVYSSGCYGWIPSQMVFSKLPNPSTLIHRAIRGEKNRPHFVFCKIYLDAFK